MDGIFLGVGLFQIVFFFMFFAISALCIVIFVVAIVKGVSQKKKNDQSPRLTTDAKVVAKRTEVTGMDRNITHYYVTFEVESGDRMELKVEGEEYGMLVEGDCGKLAFQGTRYLGFQR